MKRRMLVLTVTPQHGSDRMPTIEQSLEFVAWLESQGAPHRRIYTARIDSQAQTVTVYRFAEAIVPNDGVTRTPCVFKGYQDKNGNWVVDADWNGAAQERPTTHPYRTPPPAWVEEVAYRVEREVAPSNS
jgi:hypothetical protein